jgi:hypothetical protein
LLAKLRDLEEGEVEYLVKGTSDIMRSSAKNPLESGHVYFEKGSIRQ